MNGGIVVILIFLLIFIWLWRLVSKKLKQKEDDLYKTNGPATWEAINREKERHYENNKRKIKIKTENLSNTCPRCNGTGFNGGCDKCGGKGWLNDDHLP
jgi:DnaJ-class molecular chaperone